MLGHVSRGELSECKHDPVGRELPDWLALVDHLKVGTISHSGSASLKSGSGSSFSFKSAYKGKIIFLKNFNHGIKKRRISH